MPSFTTLDWLKRRFSIRHWQKRWDIFYRHHLEIPYLVYLRSEIPVIIYTMGKVGSASFHHSLAPHVNSFHIHSLDPVKLNANIKQPPTHYTHHMLEHNYTALQLWHHVIKPKRPVKIITLVRNPIDRNISSFFQNYARFTSVKFEESSLTVDELLQIFDNVAYEINWSQSWFDEEFHKALGIDIYMQPFPHKIGYLRINHSNIEVLVLRLGTPDKIKEEAVAGFLNLPDFQLSRSNVGEEKAYADIYSEFKKRLVLPEEYINWLLDSKYTQHFYTTQEIEKSRQKWLSRLYNQAKS